MTSSPVKLAVPHPCAQPWQTMTPDQQGRFCAHCQQTVVDFTTMTDAQVLAYLRASGDAGCGRFRTDQLDRVLISTPTVRPGRWQWLGVLLSGWLSTQVVQAQPKAVPGRHTGSSFLPVLTTPQQAVPDTAQPTSLTITGRVIDAQTRQPLSGAAVLIKGTKYGVYADSTGSFRLVFPDYTPGQTVWAVISLIGYGATQYSVQVGQEQLFAISEDGGLVEERISAGGYVVQKPTLRQRIRNRFRH